jgi:hypothetical protein
VLVLVGTLLVVSFLALWPADDMSYRCDDPPIARMFSPDPEHDETFDFFDVGEACNEAARTRGRQMAVVAVLGTIVTVTVAASERRPRRSVDA